MWVVPRSRCRSFRAAAMSGHLLTSSPSNDRICRRPGPARRDAARDMQRLGVGEFGSDRRRFVAARQHFLLDRLFVDVGGSDGERHRRAASGRGRVTNLPRPGPAHSRAPLVQKIDHRRRGFLHRAARDIDHRPVMLLEQLAGRADFVAHRIQHRHSRCRAPRPCWPDGCAAPAPGGRAIPTGPRSTGPWRQAAPQAERIPGTSGTFAARTPRIAR